MFAKEGMNYWASVRRDKIKGDMIEDAKEQGEALHDNHPPPEVPTATRKESVKRPRNTATSGESANERRFADLLRLRPPYALESAETNYRTLIQLEHPDANEDSAESNARAADLNEAIQLFRDRLQ